VSIKSLVTYCDVRIHIISIPVVHELTLGVWKIFQGVCESKVTEFFAVVKTPFL
jgi:hypothetical protein